ncbi:mtultidrug ABC transporter permease/ATPase [Chryseobacterium sp. StRB126]|uniref:peptidase domain-containing ABC transporter n=1 Tax=Chryseobacterium sp. StRB126 TaxID=878220 RepID=UPI0004E99EC7|nr:peptidase domain-containing ABC transporter [Chryseobacterium sp. StRB126]BAP32677.1 mtultidrug ABC transporter permease/ATPase [Chryseobacterium sp. StRB126]
MKFIPQHDQMDCGPACLSMIASHYGRDISLQYIRDKSFLTREGVSLLGLHEAATELGFEAMGVQLQVEDLETLPLPCIIHWNQNHFVVLREIKKGIFSKKKRYKIVDPGHGFISFNEDKFTKSWLTDSESGIALLLEPEEKFYKNTNQNTQDHISYKELASYLLPYKKQLLLLFFLLILGASTTLIFPILTQKLIDNGVNKKNINLIGIILLAQLAFFSGNVIFEIIRNWITLKIGTKISIQIISDFLKRLLHLPIKFFDTRLLGDFSQRIQDHERIEQFLTSQSILTLFSLITFSVFFGVLCYYDYRIMLVYIALTAISVVWSLFWLKKREIIDYFKFHQRGENQEAIYEIINGVSEMKLNKYEDLKRKEWENIQQKLFKTNLRILKINQIQLSGFEILNQSKNILVTFLAAYLVVIDSMSLGTLLSISYIIGQMNSPVNQLVNFFRSLQEAKLSLTRLNEVQNHPQEEQTELQPLLIHHSVFTANGTPYGIHFDKVSFQYEGPKSPFVLENIDLFIPQGKITAIVGASGSGKTTLMKLLLKFYDPTAGKIFYNDQDVQHLSPKSIRENSGTVMQDGYIFSDTIERNIATGDEIIDDHRMQHAIHIANIKSFIDGLPLGLRTKIGAAGNGISGGQKQRILIARAVYKNPHYIFFDEATSALDADNERIIHNNLQSFFMGKTVVIIAHRLSTVKNADQIIVLKDGHIVEQGNHKQLVDTQKEYYNLVKNQLELGN